MIKLDRLRTWLSQTGTQKSNQPLYQLLFYLVEATRELQGTVTANAEEASGGITELSDLDLLTHNDESAALPNSRQLVAGTGITFDDSIANQRIISATGGSSVEWSVLTDGDLDEPELIFAGGDVIMTHVP